MASRVARISLATTIGALALLAGVAAARPAETSRAPSRLLVSGDEYSLMLSRAAIRRGPAVIQFMNRGEDPHDLRLRRIGASSARTVKVPEIGSGDLVELDTHLQSGRYRLWCSLPGHRARGMRAMLTVRRGR